MKESIRAQTLYNLREKYEFCSGNDLAEFFEEMGTLSPSVETEIDRMAAVDFTTDCFRAIALNSPSLSGWAVQADYEVTQFLGGRQWDYSP